MKVAKQKKKKETTNFVPVFVNTLEKGGRDDGKEGEDIT